VNGNILLLPILLPAGLALVAVLLSSKTRIVREVILVLGTGYLLYTVFTLLGAKELTLTVPWAGPGLEFDLRLYNFSSFILLWVNVFVFLITMYSSIKMAGHPKIREYYCYLMITLALTNGAVLANNLVILVFFWEGLLLTLYGLISLGVKDAHRTAIKALIISGFCDFCMIFGVALLWYVSGTLKMSEISVSPTGLAAVSFVLMMIGAIGKGGAMPFHTWIPDAALDAPTTVMALLPGSLEKLLGVYLLTRIALDFFKLQANSPLAIVLMIIGSVTIVLAVLMALIQKDFKKLLSFHAISQFGYMVLGIGTMIPIGIAGAIFHMLNNAVYKCGLFLSAGSVEHRTGTTEMKKLGGLSRDMPITAIGYAVCALAISGIWPLNGFVSKEMIFHGSVETGYKIFAIAAWIGSIFTFASFLKAGHAIFLGPRTKEIPRVKESESPVFIPIIVLAVLTIVFGLFNKLPLSFIQEVVGEHAHGEHLNFSSHALALFNPVALISVFCLLIALGLHFYGWNKGGKKAYLASEPVHKLPGLHRLYDWSETRLFDLYEHGVNLLRALARVLFYGVDRTIDFVYEKLVVFVGEQCTAVLRSAHNGHYANYLAWCVGGLGLIVWVISLLVK